MSDERLDSTIERAHGWSQGFGPPLLVSTADGTGQAANMLSDARAEPIF
jgi:hypothetical protein